MATVETDALLCALTPYSEAPAPRGPFVKNSFSVSSASLSPILDPDSREPEANSRAPAMEDTIWMSW